LGLTLIEDLAKAHGGELRFAGNSPRGAAVELRFPGVVSS
jgi:signal transduction histidine kinase